jgi:hypothetical protein
MFKACNTKAPMLSQILIDGNCNSHFIVFFLLKAYTLESAIKYYLMSMSRGKDCMAKYILKIT